MSDEVNIRRIVSYALLVALLPQFIGFLYGLLMPLEWDAWPIVRVVIWLAIALVFARLVFVQRANPVLHVCSVLVLGSLVKEVVIALLHDLVGTSATSMRAAALRLGITAALAFVGSLAGYFFFERERPVA